MPDTPSPGNIFAFELPNATFGALICAEVHGRRNRDFRFVPVIGNWNNEPSIQQICNAVLPVQRIESTMGRQMTEQLQPGVEQFWDSGTQSPVFFVGFAEFSVAEKDWEIIHYALRNIGQIQIRPSFNAMGSLQLLQSVEGLHRVFLDIHQYANQFEWISYPASSFLE